MIHRRTIPCWGWFTDGLVWFHDKIWRNSRIQAFVDFDNIVGIRSRDHLLRTVADHPLAAVETRLDLWTAHDETVRREEIGRVKRKMRVRYDL